MHALQLKGFCSRVGKTLPYLAAARALDAQDFGHLIPLAQHNHVLAQRRAQVARAPEQRRLARTRARIWGPARAPPASET